MVGATDARCIPPERRMMRYSTLIFDLWWYNMTCPCGRAGHPRNESPPGVSLDIIVLPTAEEVLKHGKEIMGNVHHRDRAVRETERHVRPPLRKEGVEVRVGTYELGVTGTATCR